MSELTMIQMFENYGNATFNIERYDSGYNKLVVSENGEKIAEKKVFVIRESAELTEPWICKEIGDNMEMLLCFKDLVIKFDGVIKLIRFTNIENFKHTIVFVFTEHLVHFIDVFHDENTGKRKFALLGTIENIHLLYLAFDEYGMDTFVANLKNQGIREITSKLFNDVVNGIYGKHKFESNFVMINNSNVFAPLYVRIQSMYNAVQSAFEYFEGYKPQKLFSIQLEKNIPATMKVIDLPPGKVINKDSDWIIVGNKIVFLNTLEIFDLSFADSFKSPLTFECRGFYGKFCIRIINGKKILIMNIEENRYILWNLTDNKTFLYDGEKEGLDVICVNDRKDNGYDNWGGKWCPHILLRNANMEFLPDEEKIYDVYHGFYAGEAQRITSIGKPYILKCRDGKVVYFVKTYDENEKITGMMFVLDSEYNMIESRKNVNLISVYDGNALSGLKFVFFESN